MLDVDKFVREQGDRLMFIYGQWDPWTGGQFELGGAKDSLLLIQPEGTHGSRITKLTDADREAAFAKLEDWTGITPQIPPGRSSREFAPPHLPSAFSRALRARKLSP